MEVCVAHSSTNTPCAQRRTSRPTTARGPSPPRRAPRLSGSFFERPLPRQAPHRPAHGGSRNPHAMRLLERLAVLSGRVRSGLFFRCSGSHSLRGKPFRPGGPGTPFLGCRPPLSRRTLSQRLMEGTDTSKVPATCSGGTPRSTASSTRDLRSIEYGFMPRVSPKIIQRANRCMTSARRLA